jgi:hypothetical protein
MPQNTLQIPHVTEATYTGVDTPAGIVIRYWGGLQVQDMMDCQLEMDVVVTL